MAFRLQFEDLSGNLLDDRVLADGEITIGRSDDCEVVLPSSSVSREHARVFVHLGRAYVEDLRSANGVVVNGTRIRGVHPLTGPTVVVIGDHILRVTPTTQGPDSLASAPRRGAGPRPAFVRLDAALTGPRVFELGGSLLRVGRGSVAEIQIADPSVSRIHAEVRSEGPSTTVADLGSANGTFVNGQRITHPTSVTDGDFVQFGDIPVAFTTSPFTFEWRNVAAPATTGAPSPPAPSRLVWVAASLAAVVIVGAVLVLLLSLDTRKRDGVEPLQVAAQAVDAGNWSAAIAAYEAALAEDPTSEGVVDALARARRELAAETALAGCEAQAESANLLVTGTDTTSAIEAFAGVLGCLRAVDPATTAGAAATTQLRTSVLPTSLELHRDAAAQALTRSEFDTAVQHLRTARRLHDEAGASDAAAVLALDGELRSAYIAAGSSAFAAGEWARAESMLGQANAVAPLDTADAQKLATARTNAARAR